MALLGRVRDQSFHLPNFLRCAVQRYEPFGLLIISLNSLVIPPAGSGTIIMAKSGKTKSPKEVKPIPTAAKENGKTASKDSFAKAALPEKSKTKDKGKGKAKAVEPEPAPVAPFDDDDDWEDEEELDEAEVMGTAASSDQEPISDSEEEEDDEEENEDSDEDDDGVDEEGMERLLKALGEDGLDDFDKAQIMALNGAGSDVEVGSGEEGNEDEDEESEGGSHDKEYESGNEEEEEEADHARTAAKSKIAPQAADDEEYEEEDDEAIPLDEAEHSVDEDAVPRRKVEIDNKVRRVASSPSVSLAYTFIPEGRIGAH